MLRVQGGTTGVCDAGAQGIFWVEVTRHFTTWSQGSETVLPSVGFGDVYGRSVLDRRAAKAYGFQRFD